ncbi:MAG TPA: ABC transporter substrate-binding protein [Candidatus Olsenella stercoravium]|uniref:ABC transporter substrate-binding protein n=1 Tax=Candidatus Olsenella stercoravium TaxID=2838713 RepID=A0A9D2DL02_9ACTN|nr:ABC transporter substrate-binding protein [Candidatus Olsenella stercoravium]
MTDKNLNRRQFLAVAGGAAATTALAACGGTASEQGAAEGGSDAAETTKVSFVLDYTPNTNHTGLYVALDQGYFADEGLEVEIVQPPEDGADALIGAGGANLGISYQDYIANNLASDQPMPYSAVAAVIQHNTSGIMSRAEDGITHPAAMEGHTYATWNMPVEQATVRQCVEADGGNWDNVELVPYETDDDVAGLRANMYDTVWVYEAWAVQNAIVQDVDVNYFSFISVDPVFDYYTPVIAANDDFAKENPEVVKAFLRAVKKGYEYAVENPDAAADILCAQVPELDSALVHQSQTYLADQYVADAEAWGVIDKDRWAAFYGWLNDNQLLANQIDVNAGYDLSYLE